jgi:hypothetical protein
MHDRPNGSVESLPRQRWRRKQMTLESANTIHAHLAAVSQAV